MDAIPCFYDANQRIWSGPKLVNIYNSDCSVGKIIFNSLNNWPSNICQISDIDGVTVTNREALTWAIRIAQHLKSKGLNHNQIIAIIAKNSTFVLPVGIACLLNATPFHAINSSLDETALKHNIGLTKPSLIFCDGGIYEKVKAATKTWSPEIYTVTDPIDGVGYIEDLLKPTKTEMFYQPEALSLGGDQTVAILCSSGTTGLPKAICLTNKYLLISNRSLNSESVFFSNSGLDWVTGILAFMHTTLYGCTRVITNKPFTAEYFVELVRKYKITCAILSARHISELAQHPKATIENLASIKILSYGGGAITPNTLQRMKDICKHAIIISGYAMTETAMISQNIGISNTNCVGKLSAGVRVRIVDEDGKNMDYNQSGEIYVHNGNTWNGYYGNPTETQRMQDDQGWMHTGDIGYFDKKNYLYIIDRKKEILKYLGMHFWPTEIENVIHELPQVADVCVVGIYNERYGDRAGALVVKKTGAVLSESEVEEHVQKRTEVEHKHLHAGVCFVEQLPHNLNGKVLRTVAKDLFSKQKEIILDR